LTRYRITYEAREDLKSIYRYIAQDSPSAAGRLRELFYDKFRLLARFPLIGEARDDLAEGIRMFTAGNYVILYQSEQRRVTIVQIVHAARDIRVSAT
jgi:toxin ParE1/3/4